MWVKQHLIVYKYNSSRSLVPGLLTFTVCQPVDVLPPRDGGLLWILADLHLRPLVHLHQLTEADVNMKHMKMLEGSSEAASSASNLTL